MSPRQVRARLAAFVLASTMAGCATGPRPTLGAAVDDLGSEPGTATGVAEVDSLLARLDATAQATFSADYRITRKLGPVTADAAVDQAPPRLQIEVGDTRFLLGEADDRTCTGDACEPGRLDQRISGLSLGSRFYAEGAAAALRVAMARRSGQPTFGQRPLAGVVADCVTVPVGEGSDTTCVTPAGPLAYLDTAAHQIELIGWSDAASF